GPLRVFKKSQLFNFLDSVQQPAPRTMAAMIRRRKLGLSRIFALEHSRGMRHANEKHRILAGFSSCIVKCAPGMLLKHVVNMLDAREIALANAIHALIQPADRRPERNSVVPNFSFAL